MSWFALSGAVLAGIFILTTFLGRSLILLFNFEKHLSVNPQNIALTSFIGTAVLAFIACWLSELGLTMRDIATVIIPIWIILVFVAFLRYKTAFFLPEKGTFYQLVFLLISIALGSGVFLLPLAIGKSYSFLNDTYIYIAHSEYLQTHSFGFDYQLNITSQPVLWQVASNHLTGLRMGAIDFLALIQSFIPGTRAIYFFPAVSSWAMICLGLALFYFLRSNFRLPVNFAIFAIVIFGINLNPIFSGAVFGTLPQTFGLAALIWTLSLTTHILWGKTISWRSISILSLAIGFATVSYSAILPFLAVTIAISWGLTLHKSFRTSGFKTASFQMAACVGMTLLLVNYELVRALRSVPFELQMLYSKSGINVQWAAPQYWVHAIGAMGGGIDYWVIQPPWTWILALIGTCVFAIGFWSYLKFRTDWPVIILSVLFLMSWIYYGFFARNPWTQQIGQTWGLYKMDQYGYIIIFPFQMLGLYSALAKIKLANNQVYGVILVFLAIPLVFFQREFAIQKTNINRAYFNSPVPVAALQAIGNQVAAKTPQTIVLITPQDDFWPKRIFAYFLYPIPTAFSSTSVNRLPDSSQSSLCILEYTIYGMPSEPGKIRQVLPANSGIVDCEQPVISGFQNLNGVELWGNKLFLWMGKGSTTIEIWGGKSCQADLQMVTRPGPSIGSSGTRNLRIQSGDDTLDILVKSNSTLSIPVSLVSGRINTIILTPLDKAVILKQTNGDTRPLLLGISDFSVTCK